MQFWTACCQPAVWKCFVFSFEWRSQTTDDQCAAVTLQDEDALKHLLSAYNERIGLRLGSKNNTWLYPRQRWPEPWYPALFDSAKKGKKGTGGKGTAGGGKGIAGRGKGAAGGGKGIAGGASSGGQGAGKGISVLAAKGIADGGKGIAGGGQGIVGGSQGIEESHALGKRPSSFDCSFEEVCETHVILIPGACVR